MPSFIDLLLAYGLCFGLMNKVDALRSEKWHFGAFFNRMLSCSYCTGFHAGWLAWVLSRPVYGLELTLKGFAPALAWAFASSAFCYLIDTTAQTVERISSKE
jgi:hypothetical protein